MQEISKTSTEQPPKTFLTQLGGVFNNLFNKGKSAISSVVKIGEKIIITWPAQGLKRIFSAPYEKNPKTGTTLCSRTAKKNLDRVLREWIAPAGDAKDVHESYGMRPGMVKPYEKTSSFNPPENANVVDMSLDTGSKHGHRVVAYKQGNEWYVLDP